MAFVPPMLTMCFVQQTEDEEATNSENVQKRTGYTVQ